MRPINRLSEKKITKLDIQDYDNWWYGYYDEGYYYSGWYNDADDEWYRLDYNYSYDDSLSCNLHLLPNMTYHNTGRIGKFHTHRAIDLNSIYSKEELRNRKLNDLFGLPNGTFKRHKSLLEDLIKKK